MIRCKADIDRDHRAAVQRAKKTGWARQPVPAHVIATLIPDYQWWTPKKAAA